MSSDMQEPSGWNLTLPPSRYNSYSFKTRPDISWLNSAGHLIKLSPDAHHIVPGTQIIQAWNAAIVNQYTRHDGRVRDLADGFKRFLNYLEDWIGKAAACYIHPTDAEKAQEIIRGLLSRTYFHDPTALRLEGLDNIATAIFWQPGNLFWGPKGCERVDDPEDAMELSSGRINGEDRLGFASQAYEGFRLCNALDMDADGNALKSTISTAFDAFKSMCAIARDNVHDSPLEPAPYNEDLWIKVDLHTGPKEGKCDNDDTYNEPGTTRFNELKKAIARVPASKKAKNKKDQDITAYQTQVKKQSHNYVPNPSAEVKALGARIAIRSQMQGLPGPHPWAPIRDEADLSRVDPSYPPAPSAKTWEVQPMSSPETELVDSLSDDDSPPAALNLDLSMIYLGSLPDGRADTNSSILWTGSSSNLRMSDLLEWLRTNWPAISDSIPAFLTTVSLNRVTLDVVDNRNGDRRWAFTAAVDLRIAGIKVLAVMGFERSYAGTYEVSCQLALELEQRAVWFSGRVATQGTEWVLTASWQDEGVPVLALDLVKALGIDAPTPPDDLGLLVPVLTGASMKYVSDSSRDFLAFTFETEKLQFVAVKTADDKETTWALQAATDPEIGLSSLPVIGGRVTPDLDLRLTHLGIVIVSSGTTVDRILQINRALETLESNRRLPRFPLPPNKAGAYPDARQWVVSAGLDAPGGEPITLATSIV